MIMDKPVELTINEFDPPISLVFALHEHFEDCFQALKFVAETKKKIQILQFKIESSDYTATYRAKEYTNTDSGGFSIMLKKQKLDLGKMGELLYALDFELNNHRIEPPTKGDN